MTNWLKEMSARIRRQAIRREILGDLDSVLIELSNDSLLHSDDSSASSEDENEGGWSFVFVDKVDPDYECSICLRPIRDPVQTECGHLFCQTCLDRNLLESSKCPVDKKDISKDKIFSDVHSGGRIMTFKVRCTVSDIDCKWKGELMNLLKQHLDKCGNTRTRCQVANCIADVKKKKYHNHVNNKCYGGLFLANIVRAK